MKIYDQDGTEKDWAWLHAKFGDGVRVDARPDQDQPGYEVTELRAKEGPCTIVVSVHGSPTGSPDAARWWADDTLKPLPDELNHWRDKGVWGPTNDNCDIGFGMGGNDWYRPGIDWQPVSEVFAEGNSGRVCGLGWLWHTNHLHLDVRFDWVGGGGGVPPFDAQPILDELNAIIGHSEGIEALAQQIVAANAEVMAHANEAKRLLGG